MSVLLLILKCILFLIDILNNSKLYKATKQVIPNETYNDREISFIGLNNTASISFPILV